MLSLSQRQRVSGLGNEVLPPFVTLYQSRQETRAPEVPENREKNCVRGGPHTVRRAQRGRLMTRSTKEEVVTSQKTGRWKGRSGQTGHKDEWSSAGASNHSGHSDDDVGRCQKSLEGYTVLGPDLGRGRELAATDAAQAGSVGTVVDQEAVW